MGFVARAYAGITHSMLASTSPGPDGIALVATYILRQNKVQIYSHCELPRCWLWENAYWTRSERGCSGGNDDAQGSGRIAVLSSLVVHVSDIS